MIPLTRPGSTPGQAQASARLYIGSDEFEIHSRTFFSSKYFAILPHFASKYFPSLPLILIPIMRPSSSAPGLSSSLAARPSTAPIVAIPNLSKFNSDNWVAVPISPSQMPPPVPSRMFPQKVQTKLPDTAKPPTQQFDSRDRFVDDAVHINAIPRSRPLVLSAAAQFDEIHQLYHDLLLALYFQGKGGGEQDETDQKQRKRQRQRRHQRRKNPRIQFMLKRLLPLISQGLTELGATTAYRQASLEKVLPQSTLMKTTSLSSTTSQTFVQPPGGAVTWLARYLVRNNPVYNQNKVDGESLLAHRLQRKHSSLLAQCLREYDAWQLRMEQRETLENVNLHDVWQNIDTNDDGTLDVSEVGTALRALGFQLGEEEPTGVEESKNNKNNKNNKSNKNNNKKAANKTTSSMNLDLDEMQQLFSALDVDGSGDVDFDEFVLGTTRWFKGREALAKAIFDRNLHDHHETDTDDMAELLQSLARKRMIRSMQAANLDSEKLFRQIDIDADGFVDLDEFIAGISKLAAAIHDSSQHNQIIMILNRNALTLFGEIDTDGDGLISLQEFQAFVVKFLDQGIENRAKKAAERLQLEHEKQIVKLAERGKNSLEDADRILAEQRVLLLKCQTKQLSLLRPAVMRYRIEVEGDDTIPQEQTLLKRALRILSECVNAASKAERQCDVSASDLLAAHDALSVALSQPTSATRLADLKSTVNRFRSLEHKVNDPTTLEVAIFSVFDARNDVSETTLIVSSEGMPLLDLLNNAHSQARKRHTKEAEEKRKNKMQKSEQARLKKAIEAKRKRQAEERKRRKNLLDEADKEDAHLRELEEQRRLQKMREEEAKRVEERRAIRAAMRRASIAREEDFKAALKAAKEAEVDAAKHAQDRIDNWDPNKSVFCARGIGQHANFFDSDKTCQQAVALELERALSKPAVVTLINHPMENQVEEVRKALLHSANGTAARALLDVYRHYCLSGHHMFAMQKFGFDQFVNESGIADPNSRTATAHHLETTFVASNMNTPGVQAGDRPDRSLNRAEFIEAIIRMAIQKFYADRRKRTAAATTGEAVMRIITEQIIPLKKGEGVKILSPICDANEIREKVLYTMQIDDIFRQDNRIEFLQHIFDASASQKSTGKAGDNGSRMNIIEWMRFVRGVVGKDGGQNSKLLQFSELAAKECFLLSRLTVVDQARHGDRCKQMSFEDFLEALVRLTEIVQPENEDGRDETKWDKNNPVEVAPRLDALIDAIMFKYDRDGDGGVSHAEINHARRHGRRGTRFEV